jgi:hypothetical protein
MLDLIAFLAQQVPTQKMKGLSFVHHVGQVTIKTSLLPIVVFRAFLVLLLEKLDKLLVIRVFLELILKTLGLTVVCFVPLELTQVPQTQFLVLRVLQAQQQLLLVLHTSVNANVCLTTTPLRTIKNVNRVLAVGIAKVS